MPETPKSPKKPVALEAPTPKIPGIPPPKPKKPAPPRTVAPAASQKLPAYIWAAGGAVLLAVLVALVWWIGGSKQPKQTLALASANPATPSSAAKPALVQDNAAPPVAPGVIATTDELSQPWTAKKFVFTEHTGKKIPALVVRLPDATYWAFSLREPYGSCELEYITDLDKLRMQYNFSATHPMVGDPCSHTVFDLATYGSGPSGEVRGEIVAGTGVRPPLAIEVEVHGTKILATRAEADILH